MEHIAAIHGATSDIIVVGAGPGGMAATAAAAAKGATVQVVEAEGRIGGNAIHSTGYLAFVGSPMQQERGIRDSEEVFVRDGMRMADAAGEQYGVVCDESLVRMFARQSGAVARRLLADGVVFDRFIPRPRQHTVDRMVAVADPRTLGTTFERHFARPEVTTLFHTVAERLILRNGSVVGVRVRRRTGSAVGGNEQLGEPADIYARHGVVLAAGGYQANPELRLRYQPRHLALAPYLGIESCRGDGHLMGQAIGGDLVNMTYVPPLVMVASSLVEDTIAVNEAGRRFHDEAGPYEERVAALRAQPGRRGWYVFDAVTAQAKQHLVEQMPEPPRTGGSLSDLAEAIGCTSDALEMTVAEWNGWLTTGGDQDPMFGRVVLPAGRRPIVTAPFAACPMVVGINFISGGFVVTEDMQVVDVFGHAIRGLFAAGDCIGGFNPIADLGGIRIAGGFTLGHIAGLSSAAGVHRTTPLPSVQHQVLPSRARRNIEIIDVTDSPR